MSGSILSRNSLSFSQSTSNFSPLQTQVDGLVSRFVEEASSPTTLGALMAGGLAYRLTRVGVMGMGSSSLLRPLSVAVGLGSEVSAYEFTNRFFHTVGATGQSPLQPNLWRWDGTGGWRQGLISSTITGDSR